MQFIMCSNIIYKIPQIFVFSVLLKRTLWNNLYSLVLLMQTCICTILQEKFDFSEAISFCFSKWLNLYFICDIDNIILDLFQTVHLTLGRLHRFKRDICLCVCEPEKWKVCTADAFMHLYGWVRSLAPARLDLWPPAFSQALSQRRSRLLHTCSVQTHWKSRAEREL